MVLDVSYYLILLSEVECCLCFVCWEVEWSPAQVERSCVGEERCWCSRDWSCSAEHQPCVRDCWLPWDRWEVETEQHSEREDWSQQLVWEVHDDIHQENFQVLLSRTHPHPCTKLFFKIIPIKSKVFVKSWNNFSSDMIVFIFQDLMFESSKKKCCWIWIKYIRAQPTPPAIHSLKQWLACQVHKKKISGFSFTTAASTQCHV